MAPRVGPCSRMSGSISNGPAHLCRQASRAIPDSGAAHLTPLHIIGAKYPFMHNICSKFDKSSKLKERNMICYNKLQISIHIILIKI